MHEIQNGNVKKKPPSARVTGKPLREAGCDWISVFVEIYSKGKSEASVEKYLQMEGSRIK